MLGGQPNAGGLSVPCLSYPWITCMEWTYLVTSFLSCFFAVSLSIRIPAVQPFLLLTLKHTHSLFFFNEMSCGEICSFLLFNFSSSWKATKNFISSLLQCMHRPEKYILRGCFVWGTLPGTGSPTQVTCSACPAGPSQHGGNCQGRGSYSTQQQDGNGKEKGMQLRLGAQGKISGGEDSWASLGELSRVQM